MQSSIDHANEDCMQLVPINDLLKKPEKYNQNTICVEGFLVIEFEHRALYISEEDASKRAYQKAIWLSFENSDKELLYKMHKLKNNYVYVKGSYEAGLHGHGSLFFGEMVRISSLEEALK
jgi:hypothetical protein